MLLLYHALIKDDLTTLISNWKILDKLCNEYSKGIYLDIESHPQPGTISRFYKWTICQIVIAYKLGSLEGIKHYTLKFTEKEHIVVCIQWC